MLRTPRHAILLLLAVVVPMAACDQAAKAPEAEVAAAPAKVLPPFQQEVGSAKAEVTLPGEWKYGYRLVDKADTTHGAYRAFEFHYVADTAAKVPPRLLLVIRVFKKATWEKIRVSQGTVAKKLAEHGDDVYAFSIVTSNPYPLNTLSALRVDAMMLALMAETSPFKMTFK
jgi:hypothetical protein